MTRVDKVRVHGYATIDQEVEIGLRSIAVPLFGQRTKVVAALNIGMAATHESVAEIVSEFLPKLLVVQEGLKRVR
jgi:IclR family pca regulon transcriptional regulator